MSIFQKANTGVGVKEILINDVSVGFQPCYTGRGWGGGYAGNAVRADVMFPTARKAWAFVDEMEEARKNVEIRGRLVSRD